MWASVLAFDHHLPYSRERGFLRGGGGNSTIYGIKTGTVLPWIRTKTVLEVLI